MSPSSKVLNETSTRITLREVRIDSRSMFLMITLYFKKLLTPAAWGRDLKCSDGSKGGGGVRGFNSVFEPPNNLRVSRHCLYVYIINFIWIFFL